jgi:hypothetical protein
MSMELKEVIVHLRDYTGPTHRLLTTWADTPMVLMMEEDWARGPLVIIGAADRMMWPLLPPGSLLRLDPKARKIDDRSWPEFERPVSSRLLRRQFQSLTKTHAYVDNSHRFSVRWRRAEVLQAGRSQVCEVSSD